MRSFSRRTGRSKRPIDSRRNAHCADVFEKSRQTQEIACKSKRTLILHLSLKCLAKWRDISKTSVKERSVSCLDIFRTCHSTAGLERSNSSWSERNSVENCCVFVAFRCRSLTTLRAIRAHAWEGNGSGVRAVVSTGRSAPVK
jgi:hypothetical protein